MISFFHSLPTLVKALLLTLLLSPLTVGYASEAGLHIYSGAGLRNAVEEVARLYRTNTGNPVTIEYGGSGQMMARIQLTHSGDLFISGAMPYIDQLNHGGEVLSSHPIALHGAVLAINKSAAEKIKSFDDLAKPGIRIALGDAKAMALGRTADDILSHSDKQQAIRANVVVHALTMSQLAIYVSSGDVDAAIIGHHDMIKYADKLTSLPIPENYFKPEVVGVAVLKSTTHRQDAEKFVALLTSTQGKKAFSEAGFPPVGHH